MVVLSQNHHAMRQTQQVLTVLEQGPPGVHLLDQPTGAAAQFPGTTLYTL